MPWYSRSTVASSFSTGTTTLTAGVAAAAGIGGGIGSVAMATRLLRCSDAPWRILRSCGGGTLRFLTKWWPPMVAAAATIGYAVAVLGFGLDFRPLQNDEGVTLAVASKDSVREVLHTAIDLRHGPPLHYLLVHASLEWRDDILGLRLPSAVLGILAVAISYGTGRELLGRGRAGRSFR